MSGDPLDATQVYASTIAAGLSEAQRKAILAIGDPSRPFSGLFITGLDTAEELDLKRRGIVRWAPATGTMGILCTLTPLGLAVREELLKGTHDDR
jgi:hypothetical protein